MAKRLKVLVVSVNQCTVPFAVMPFGACVIAEAAAAAGHEVKMLDLMFERDRDAKLRSTMEEFAPDVVGISLRNIDNNDLKHPVSYISGLRDAAVLVRSMSRAEIILGGAAVGVMPEQLLGFSGITYAVAGNGEQAFVEIVSRISENKDFGDVPGVASIMNGTFRMNGHPVTGGNAAPVADFRKWITVRAYGSHMTATPVQTKRGCPHKCIYCTYGIAEGSAYRLYTPESVVENVKKLVADGFNDIEFVDNVFNSPYEHATAVCEALIQADTGARFQTLELNPMFVDDALLGRMEKAGFTGIGITAESASDTMLTNLRKGYDATHVRAAAEAAGRHRLPVMWIFMLGGPGENEETVTETFAFAKKYIRKNDVAFFNAGIRIYPGTELERMARASGYLTLSPAEMLEPVFYTSPLIGETRLSAMIKDFTDQHMNFLTMNTIHSNILPAIYKLARAVGVKPPLWRFTPPLRRAARLLGANV